MERDYRLLTEINAESDTWTVLVKVVRVWTTPTYNDDSKINTIEAIVIDEEGNKMHVIIIKRWVSKFQNALVENRHYRIRNFTVGDATAVRFMMASSKMNINFYKKTTLKYVNPTHDFGSGLDFIDFSDISKKLIDTKIPFDVIAEIESRGRVELTSSNGKQRRLLTLNLKDFSGITLRCALWNQLADQVDEYLNNEQNIGRVVIAIQLAKLKYYQCQGQISNCLWGTRIWLNSAAVPQIDELLQRLYERDGPHANNYRVPFFHRAPTESQRTEEWSSVNERTKVVELALIKKDVQVLICGTIKSILAEEDWMYFSHRRCNKIAKCVEDLLPDEVTYPNVDNHSYHCKECRSFVSDVLPRYKVNIRVQDGSGTATLVLFDGSVVALINKSADELYSAMKDDDDAPLIPEELQSLINKQYLFKVEVTEWNYDERKSTTKKKKFTVRRITEDDELIKEFLKRTDPPQESYSAATMSVGNETVSQPNQSQKDAASVTGENVNVDEDINTAESPLPKKRVNPLEDHDVGEYELSTTKKTRRKVILDDDDE